MPEDKLELMVNEMIAFLKKKEMWEADVGIIYNGKDVSHKGIVESNEVLKGVARMWFERPLTHILNNGDGDSNFKIYKRLEAIMEKHSCYPVFDSYCDFNIYPI